MLLIILLIFPLKVFPAEVLQVNSSSVLQVGDNNRNYKIKIACIETLESKDQELIEWLKHQLPRHTKVNFFPQSSKDGILIARVISLKSNLDLATEIIQRGYAKATC